MQSVVLCPCPGSLCKGRAAVASRWRPSVTCSPIFNCSTVTISWQGNTQQLPEGMKKGWITGPFIKLESPLALKIIDFPPRTSFKPPHSLMGAHSPRFALSLVLPKGSVTYQTCQERKPCEVIVTGNSS